MNKISVYQSVKTHQNVQNYEPTELIDLIKSGFDNETRKIHSQITKCNDKDEVNKLKKKLKIILWSGNFKEGTRSKSTLIEGTRFLQVDLDNFDTTTEMNEARELLKRIPSIYAIFNSPSGKGLKAIARCKMFNTPEEYTQAFISFQNEYTLPNFDPCLKDISRSCFIPLSEDIYANFDADEYVTKEVENNQNIAEVPVIIVDDELAYCLSFTEKKMQYNNGNRNNFIHLFNCNANRLGIDMHTTLDYCLTNFNLDQQEIKDANKSSYKNISEFGKYKNKMLKLETINEKNKIEESIDFHSIDEKGKITIDIAAYFNFLNHLGFYKRNNDTNFELIHIVKNIAEVTSESKMEDVIKKNTPNPIYSFMKNKGGKYFTKAFFQGLKNIEISPLKDSEKHAYIPFLNGVVRVEADQVSVMNYNMLGRPVWRNNIIKRNFKGGEFKGGNFADFIFQISKKEVERYNYFRSIIGYLLHNFKSRANAKAVIFSDETISDVADGRSGKSLVAYAIEQIRNVKTINGKSGENDFRYEGTTEEHDIVYFDDVKKNFDFESKFPLITGDLIVNRKGVKAITIPFDIAPKILISTNYVLEGDTGSFQARQCEVEFYQYFTANRTPEQEYGERFFENWTEDEWNNFDSWMIECVKIYFKNGVPKLTSSNLILKKLHQGTNSEFVEWINDENDTPIKVNEKYVKGTKHTEFTQANPNLKNTSIRKFMNWIKKYSDFKGWEYEDLKSDGSRCFRLKNTEIKIQN